jgi:hypothetical protein
MSEWIGSIDELMAQGWREGSCAACGHTVVTDGAVILDRDPTDDGDTVIHSDRRKARATSVIPDDVVGRIPLWRSHFYTCPRHLVETR